MPLSEQEVLNLTDAATAAVATENQYHLPAELTLAQWALESGWGTKMPAGSNNPFGIKAEPGEPSVTAETKEYVGGVPEEEPQPFRAFPTLTDAFNYHAEVLTTGRPYRMAWQTYQTDQDLDGLIERVAHIYATSPTYADQLQQILAMPEVKGALASARGISS
jgi:flagellum-specific peptidoglycan hydrolase FlgJ